MAPTIFLAPGRSVSGPATEVVRLDRIPRRRRAPTEIEVLGSEPAEPYEPIASIEAIGSVLPPLDHWIQQVAAEAARVGGDAVILGATFESRGLLARVIVFRPGPPRGSRRSLQATA